MIRPALLNTIPSTLLVLLQQHVDDGGVSGSHPCSALTSSALLVVTVLSTWVLVRVEEGQGDVGLRLGRVQRDPEDAARGGNAGQRKKM